MVFSCHADNKSIEELFVKAEQIKISDHEKFKNILNELIKQKSDLEPDQKDELEYLTAFVDIASGEYDQAKSKLNTVFQKTHNLKVKIRSQLTISNLHAFTGSYEQAFLSLNFVSEHIEEVKEQKLVNLIFYAIANTYLLTNQYELSLKFSQLLMNQATDTWELCRAQTLYGSASLKGELKDYSEADINFTFNQCVKNGHNTMGHYLKLIWISKQLEKLIRPYDNQILEYYLGELNSNAQISTVKLLKSVELTDMSLRAKMHWMLGQVDEAALLAKQVIDSPDTMGDNEPRVMAYKVLESIAAEAGDHAQAYYYLSKLAKIESELNLDNQLKQMAFMNVQHANLARELENEQLNKTNNLLKIQQQLDHQEAMNNKLLLALLLFVLSVLVYVVYRMKKRHDELESLAAMDHLTKVLNRKGFEVAFAEVLETANNSGDETHLAILDLDFFKKVNDEHGHLTGDWILKHVIYEVKKHLDSKMVIGRLGGEEFGILGSAMSSKEMDSRIEGIRGSIEKLDCSESGHDIKITASFGITSSELSGHTMQMMLGHADLALYQAKSRGRNQWVRYQYIN